MCLLGYESHDVPVGHSSTHVLCCMCKLVLIRAIMLEFSNTGYCFLAAISITTRIKYCISCMLVYD